MLDPMISMAFAVQCNKGVYALLVGSGVSRGASIPTGAEVVQVLLGRLATIHGADGEPDLSLWFKRTFNADPDYSSLLDQLASKPDERRQLLSEFFEPTPEEKEQNLKTPTAAHKALARLVAGGYIVSGM